MAHFFGIVLSSAENANFSNKKWDKLGATLAYQDDHIMFFSTAPALQLKGTTTLETNNYILVGNWRIDNQTVLNERLKLAPNTSGGECILAAFEQYKNEIAEHLIGDFAFVLWDKKEQALFMVKDHLGIRPLFYAPVAHGFAFASSISLLKVFADFEVNQTYIAKNLKAIIPAVEETFYQGIFRLKPAHYLSYNAQNSSFKEVKYWELKAKDLSGYKNDDELLAALKNIFIEAVVCRAKNHAKIGCQLSGGMDSSAITVILARAFSPENLYTYSFVLSEKTKAYSKNGIDEQTTQETIINYANLKRENHHYVKDFRISNTFEQFEYSNKIMGGFAHSDAIWQDAIFYAAAEQGTSIVFSGFLGDEIFSTNGQNYYKDYFHNLDFKNLKRYFKESGLKGLKNFISYFLFKYKIRKFSHYLKDFKQKDLLNPKSSFNNSLSHQEAYELSFKAQLLNAFYSPHNTLRTESEWSYAINRGVETTYPMGDIRLIEFVYSLPSHLFKPNPLTRALFRQIANNILPDEVRLQPKFNGAFTLAYAEYWIQKQLLELETYAIKDRFGLMNANRLNKDDLNIQQKKSKVMLKKLDYLIEKHSGNR